MKYKLLPILVCLALLASFLNPFTTSISAGSIAPLDVYVKYGSESPILVKTYSQVEMEDLSNSSPQYYTGIDSMPCVVQGKAYGVTLLTLIDDLTQYDSDIHFSTDTSIKLYASDGVTATFTYDYLLGATRYYYPNLCTSSEECSILGDTLGGVPIEPMFAVTSYQDRSFDNDLLSRQLIDTKTLDTARSYRFCFGLFPSDVTSVKPTANKFIYWVNRIDIILPAATTTTVPVWDLNGDHYCNLNDVVLIGLKWKLTGTAGWIAEDINKDGVINIGDVVTLGFHWGETW
jgi:hypothetical protein